MSVRKRSVAKVEDIVGIAACFARSKVQTMSLTLRRLRPAPYYTVLVDHNSGFIVLIDGADGASIRPRMRSRLSIIFIIFIILQVY